MIRYLAVIQGLGLELKTGMKLTRGPSALRIAQQSGYTSVTGNATKRNLALALAEMLANLTDSSGPVATRGRLILDEWCEANNVQITFA